MICDFAERACTSYSFLLRTTATNYRERLNAMLADAQMQGEYLDGFPVRVSENSHSWQIEDADSDEERGACTPPAPLAKFFRLFLFRAILRR